MRAFSAEFKIPEAGWPSIVPASQSIINNAPSRPLGNKAPITVHTGMESGNPLKLAISVTKLSNAASIYKASILQSLKVTELQKALDYMHKEVNLTFSDSRKKAVTRHSSRTGV